MRNQNTTYLPCKFLTLILTAIILSGCGSHKGAIRPNAGLADFDKYGEAYFLDVNQIPIGSSEEHVKSEYGSKFDIVKSDTSSGKLLVQWKFTSYRATFATDPIQKYMYVTFIDHRVSSVDEVYVGKPPKSKKAPASNDGPIEQLEKLKKLHFKGIITDDEYETKRTIFLNKID